jgi:hypothetical protein
MTTRNKTQEVETQEVETPTLPRHPMMVERDRLVALRANHVNAAGAGAGSLAGKTKAIKEQDARIIDTVRSVPIIVLTDRVNDNGEPVYEISVDGYLVEDYAPWKKPGSVTSTNGKSDQDLVAAMRAIRVQYLAVPLGSMFDDVRVGYDNRFNSVANTLVKRGWTFEDAKSKGLAPETAPATA